MQSFSRERSGFHGNQPCYQQEPHELSRLESYRQHPHHGQTRQVYEAQDCYSQQAYPGYPQGNGGAVAGGGSAGGPTSQAKKPYRGGSKVPPPPPQHMQAGGYSNHMGPGGYSAQYMSEGHLQQSKWDDPAQLAQYEQEMVGRLEPGPPGSSQYLDQNMLAHSQSQCHQPHQGSAPVYTSPHHQPHPTNPTQSPLMYPQGHLHYPQHSPSPSPSSSSYMEKCSSIPHCYKGYSMPPGSQYARQMGSHSSLKQGGYRPPPQNNYSYQQPPSRGGYEPQPPLQGMPTSQEAHPKYQHFSQPQQNYCLSELSVRSPEQYYQTCSPASSHSPARSVGRSPSYSSTPSPLMTNPENFQYGQPPMTPGTTSSSSTSSAGLQDQGLLLPPRSHPSPSPGMAHLTPQHSYVQGGSVKERFSEKLLANPSLWSLNALTSQVENISNNVQQLLLSEALVANKKGGKRSSSIGSSGGGSSKKGEEFKAVTGAPEGQQGGGPSQDPYGSHQQQPLPMEMQEGGYSSSSDEQLERGYYYCGQGRSPAQALNNTHLGLDTTSSCSMTSPDDMSTRSGDSISGVQSVASRDNLTPDPRSQGDQNLPNTPMKSMGDERSPASVTVLSPMKQESQSPPDIQRLGEPLKENFEESAWTEKMADDEDDRMKKTKDSEPDCKSSNNVTDDSAKQEKWQVDEKGHALYSKINKAVTEGKSYCYDDNMYHEIQNKYEHDERDLVEKSPGFSDSSNKQELLGQEMKSEVFKSESPNDSESSVKTSPFISSGDHDQDQYLTEKEDSSENASPTPRGETLNKRLSALEKRDNEEYEEEKEEERQQHSISPLLSAEERTGEESESLPSTEEVINNRFSPQENPSGELCHRTKGQGRAEPQINSDRAETETKTLQLGPALAAETSERGSAICDTPPQSHSVMPVFSALNDKATPPAPAQSRDHIDHSDAKVLEPDSPQLPGKSILHSAPSWADTPPSPKKGDEDMEPGINCPSAVTPSAKLEPMAPSAHPRAFGRKHARGRRRLMHSGVGIRRQLTVEKEGESVPSPPQKPCMPSSKSVLFSDQMDMAAHQDFITTISEMPKVMVEGSRSRMCTRSFNTQDTPPKDPQPTERRKPGRKPGSKPGPKPGPKPGLKPGIKPVPKLVPKASPKPGPKSSLKPELKPGPKPGLKPGLKPGPKAGLKPGTKPGPKPGPKTGLKLTEGAPRGRPKGTGSKSKLTQQEGSIQSIIESPGRNRKCLSVNSNQGDENQEVIAPGKDRKNMILRSRKPPQDKLTKEKDKEQAEENLIQTLTDITKPNAVSKSEEPMSIEQALSVFPNQTDTSITDISIPVTPSEKPAETTIAVLQGTAPVLPHKRKHSPQPLEPPVKKKRGPKPKPQQSQPENLQVDQGHQSSLFKSKEIGERGPKKKLKRGQHLKASLTTVLTKDNPPPIMADSDVVSEIPSVPPQCPTKTKYLPPRKGRGLKYEAMVQKINSGTSSKKHPPTPQPEITVAPVEEVTSKPVSLSIWEESETPVLAPGNAPEETWEEVTGDMLSSTRVQNKEQLAGVQQSNVKGLQPESNPACVLAASSTNKSTRARTKRRRWAVVESTDTTVVAMETGSLIINTPRLAKQRAIKNNHEMHLKQRRKKRKGGQAPSEEVGAEDKVEIPTGDQVIETEAQPTTDTTITTTVLPAEITDSPQMIATEAIQPPSSKRGRKPSSSPSKKRGRGRAPGEQPGNKPLKMHRKPGPKKGIKDAMEVIEAVVKAAGMEPRLKKKKSKKNSSTLFEEEAFDPFLTKVISKTTKKAKISKSDKSPKSKIKHSFCPYVRIDSSQEFASLCTIINRPNEELKVVLHKPRKKSQIKIKNPVMVAKAMSSSSAMLQGPLVNKTLVERCLTCCLCGKPANYRELGDLCGPYYPEDSIPRKILEEGNMETAPKEGSSSNARGGLHQQPHAWRPRRAERALAVVGGPHRVTLRDRFRRMQQLQEERRAAEASGQEGVRGGGGGLLQRLQGEAEAKEHWAHENCAIWTNGVIMVAGRLYGLKEAARTSAEMVRPSTVSAGVFLYKILFLHYIEMKFIKPCV
uniref:Retinoic acid induced 1 n=1 Tax=Esox lucius TaxID=8010 RepID=A0AAY5KMJ0_ESOLU